MDNDAAIIAAVIARRFEGFYPRPYLCPAGVPTIGYGATYYEDGARVTLQDPPITRERAEALLAWMLRKVYLPQVLRLCPGIMADANRTAAVLDLAFNIGGSAVKASTLRKRINAQAWDQVPAEFRKWTRGGGRVLPGLVRRREAEIAILP